MSKELKRFNTILGISNSPPKEWLWYRADEHAVDVSDTVLGLVVRANASLANFEVP